MKNSRLVFLIAGFAAIMLAGLPFYSYAIDYTASEENSEGGIDFTTTAPSNEEREFQPGLQKTIRVPEKNEIEQKMPRQGTPIQQDALRDKKSGQAKKADGQQERKNEEECTDEDRKAIKKHTKKLQKYAELVTPAHQISQQLLAIDGDDRFDLKEQAEKATRDALKAIKMTKDEDFVAGIILYKKCKVFFPNSAVMPVPSEIFRYMGELQ